MSKLQEAKELLAATELVDCDEFEPWVRHMRRMLAAMVAEVERLQERESYHEAHVELLQQFEETALQNLAEAKARMLMLEQQVVALRKVESTWGHRSAGKNEAIQ